MKSLVVSTVSRRRRRENSSYRMRRMRVVGKRPGTCTGDLVCSASISGIVTRRRGKLDSLSEHAEDRRLQAQVAFLVAVDLKEVERRRPARADARAAGVDDAAQVA